MCIGRFTILLLLLWLLIMLIHPHHGNIFMYDSSIITILHYDNFFSAWRWHGGLSVHWIKDWRYTTDYQHCYQQFAYQSADSLYQRCFWIFLLFLQYHLLKCLEELHLSLISNEFHSFNELLLFLFFRVNFYYRFSFFFLFCVTFIDLQKVFLFLSLNSIINDNWLLFNNRWSLRGY